MQTQATFWCSQRAIAMALNVFWIAGAPARAAAQNPAPSDTACTDARGWRIPFSGSPSEPTVAYGIAYVGSLDGSLYAFDSCSGTEVWHHRFGEWPTVRSTEGQSIPGMRAAARAARGSVEATPLVADEAVYIGLLEMNSRRYAPGEQHQPGDSMGPPDFFAFDARSGDVKWSLDVGGGINGRGDRGQPILRNGVVYFSSEGFVFAVDAHTGEPRWVFETLAEVDYRAIGFGARYVLWMGDSPSRVALDDGMLFVTDGWGPGGLKDDPSITATSYLHAIDAGTGEKRWTFTTGGAGATMPAVSNGTVFFSVESASPSASDIRRSTAPSPIIATLYAVDAERGTKLWSLETGQNRTHSRSDIIVGDGVVFFATDLSVLAVDVNSGEVRWHLDREQRYRVPFLLHGGIILIRDDRDLVALDPASGADRWSARVDKGAHLELVSEGLVYLAWDRRLRAIELATGERVWESKLDSDINHVQAADGWVYVITGGEWVVGKEPKTGYLYKMNSVTGKP